MSNRTRSDVEDMTQLVNSKKRVFHPNSPNQVLEALQTIEENIQTAYVLGHTPEQGEDIYRILVNGQYVVGFDLQKNMSPVVLHNVKKYSVSEYQKLIAGGSARRYFDAALRLSIADIAAIKGSN